MYVIQQCQLCQSAQVALLSQLVQRALTASHTSVSSTQRHSWWHCHCKQRCCLSWFRQQLLPCICLANSDKALSARAVLLYQLNQTVVVALRLEICQWPQLAQIVLTTLPSQAVLPSLIAQTAHATLLSHFCQVTRQVAHAAVLPKLSWLTWSTQAVPMLCWLDNLFPAWPSLLPQAAWQIQITVSSSYCFDVVYFVLLVR